MVYACVEELINVLEPDTITPAEALHDRRMADWSGYAGGTGAALVRPRTTEDLSLTLAICNRHRAPVIVQGGLTGLAGAATCQDGEIMISLERMRAIEELDPVSATLTVQAGAALQHVQEAAEAAGFYFPLDLGARGSCTVGGLIGTNAGGNRVIKYGMTRAHVLDVEAVLADGSVIGGQRKMLKNNTGYDLPGLLVGSEGTLAVVTRAVLRLQAPTVKSTAWCGLASFEAVTALLRRAQERLSGGVSAFELMWPSYYGFVLTNFPKLRRPLEGSHAFNVLLETDGSGAANQQDEFIAFLADMLEDGLIADAAVANSDRDAADFWAIRDAPGEFPRMMPEMVAFDISFAVSQMSEAVDRITGMLAAAFPQATALFYGHIGDGNIHLIVDPLVTDAATKRAIEQDVYAIVGQLNGAVSAEHGIGLKKRDVLPQSRSASDLAAMRAIKAALDPNHILARGRIFGTVA
ncbi:MULTISPECIES: FAD-binding oxidoreductase [unclassified Sphingomonas]|uniref:FAD-binding oxidoreductase n=1 Tax=unclassified Sphingomonas TaxID=196159 RepID=UPI00070225BE|nr:MULTISPECIES: FAD-binding oxidoreductase [unclassified Sphingomonas]KQX23375.1 FAD-linked oxidase [Sphingomonas sp. Root1294]KQY68226.1 FAD-linked oxidase [Sphingomonas sp. Root50]KRB91123.1 FAD-linked oxidase [Sphingomonas sp. Root720]